MSVDLEEQYDKIYRYCYYKLHQRETAEDITQETFLRFLESESYQNTGKELRYLYTIARNLCIDEFRKKTAAPMPPGLPEYKENENEDRILTSLALKDALSCLTPEEQEILLLKYVNEVPVTVICRFLGISRFVLYRKTTKALRRLKEAFYKEDLS